MRGVRIPHDLSGQDRFVLGLSVTSLAVLLFGLLGAYTALHLALPIPIRLVLAVWIAGPAAAFAWIRPEGRSLLEWVSAAVEFKLSRHAEAPSQSTRSDQGLRRPRLAVVAQPEECAPQPPQVLDDDVIELPESRPPQPVPEDETDAPELGGPTPVYLGGTQVIAFFSIKGGTGRTTLTTEIACLLASKGWYRESARARAHRLKVVLIDFDLGSANVPVRVGLTQPTILDYLADLSSPAAKVSDYLLCHESSGLQILLGSPKCLTGQSSLMFGVPQAAQILAALKAEGYHFIFVDLGSTFTDLDVYLLQAVDRIFCLVTPTAGSIQDLYRGVEALRRLGLGPKLRYVANKMRDRWNLAEPMGDLGGTLVARIPYDIAFELAENHHEPYILRGRGDTLQALYQLGSSIYPGLYVPDTARSAIGRFNWLARSRHAS